MPDTVPADPLSIDEAKIYLVRGTTLARLLKLESKIAMMEGKNGVQVAVSEKNIIIDFDTDQLRQALTSGGGTLPTGVVWEEFTICDSGSPATRWLPTSLTDPSSS